MISRDRLLGVISLYVVSGCLTGKFSLEHFATTKGEMHLALSVNYRALRLGLGSLVLT